MPVYLWICNKLTQKRLPAASARGQGFNRRWLALVLAVGLIFPLGAASARVSPAEEGVVEVILYWEQGCPACEKVLREVIPPLQEQYGEQLALHKVEVITLEDIEALYRIGAAHGLSKDQVGLPMALIGEVVLVGAEQIPRQLPGLIEAYLAQGGVKTEPDATSVPAAATTEAAEPFWSGMELAWGLLALMALALGYTIWQAGRAFLGAEVRIPFAGGSTEPAKVRSANPGSTEPAKAGFGWSVPLLALLGLAVALYLTYVEATYTPAVCGPVGDCNAVQNSPYARLFGVIPVGLFGAFGYLAILAAWQLQKRRNPLSAYMPAAVLGMAAFGVLYSIYLTCLEIFVIRAVCIWCLASALIITLIMLASLPAAVSWLLGAEEETP